MQELGETVQEMIKDDDQVVQDILNQNPRGHYWIVIHHKQTKQRLKSGEVIIRKLIKAYSTKPNTLLGTVILEVKDGEVIGHEINLHDAPIDWGSIIPLAGHSENPYVQHRPGLGRAFIYNE
jgi:hypothetical protein